MPSLMRLWKMIGHQAPAIRVIWLDEDSGLHKDKGKEVIFPNARVENVKIYFSTLAKLPDGFELINKFEQLTGFNGAIKKI